MKIQENHLIVNEHLKFQIKTLKMLLEMRMVEMTFEDKDVCFN
jgi:hypothetical protein